MSRLGIKIAQLFGRKLPGYRTPDEARAALFAARDTRLAQFLSLAAKSPAFTPDGTPTSLKTMEAWYFQLLETDGFKQLGVSPEDFGKGMGVYFGHVAVAHAGAEWCV